MSISAWDWLRNRFSNKQSQFDSLPCFWQNDVHSHLIPGVDDGVTTLDESVDCLRKLAGWGIEKVITTPHVSQRFNDNETAVLLAGRDTLRQRIEAEQLSIQIEVAAEYMLDESFLSRLEASPLLSFGTDQFLLIEINTLAQPLQLNDLLFRIQTTGYTPVLAHPERYPYYYNQMDDLERLRDLGCLLQLNWMSLTGRYGSRARNQARQLLKNHWVDLIGSDVHRPADLPALESLFTSSSYDLLREQPLRNHLL